MICWSNLTESTLDTIPWFVWDAKLWLVHVDINNVEQETEWEAVWRETEWIQSEASDVLISPQLTLEEKEEILSRLDDIFFLEALMKELSVDTSKMLLIIENTNILSDSKSWYQIQIQLDTWDDYYIDSSTYNKVLNSYYRD
jgi:hypothetical protein